ncbi:MULTISPECIES: 2Fe-2S iron-sulfur cluster-binding protein [unclassified Synechocystis]|uniref:2Fe-2S iron-sulfur cluster-binding protein n=1 Tax=unclassified Synechocystis TaxID=2640012 RepID=UPI000417FCF0|nr:MULTISPECIES: 2Fe-2S iron-sulfur cluster-binding protein [unclassified Synechocystis]AIE74164.1 Ferredoxin [Synechocystis sp. PCC 6714]MCT0252800.1 (2Fe-2S)-binding protein [Synechocystis sp. CS-94]
MNNCVISFPKTTFSCLSLKAHACLAEYLTVENSPILFGCRTGLCGTCLVKVIGEIPPPKAEERELLAILAPQDSQARLACQIELTGDIAISPYQTDAI